VELLLAKTEDIKRSWCSFPSYCLDYYRTLGVYGQTDGRTGAQTIQRSFLMILLHCGC
jgi:hypothetical protein